ncbi:MAG TPA: LamG domain-containing protein [Actinophytocola sp.]|uniref:LamG domain-containing protein n=1 Tax=Actinophytocola sp. TaxID=1872138 RepID=UPI002DDCB6CA|nr:LamG domain-containing protein [Actinophytocola sp.]HEV2778820.1 LamG domain-containing protein [Actinophytocola sp.]
MAVRFDAASENYTAATGLPSNVYTFAAWIRPAAVGATNRVVYWLTTSGDVFTGIQVRSNASTDLQAYDSGSYAFNGLGPLSASAGVWYRVALVVNGANATFYRAAAGDVLGSASAANFTTPATPTSFHLGDDPYDEYWDGRLAAVKMWQAALTPAEVEVELGQYTPRRTADLLRWHPFITAEATDYSGNGHTLSGGTGTTTEDGPPIPWGAAPIVLGKPAAAVAGEGLAGRIAGLPSAVGSVVQPATRSLVGAVT